MLGPGVHSRQRANSHTCSIGRWSLMCRSMGSTKASVLPEPVLAIPRQSRPDMMAGRAWAWTASGASNPDLRRTSSVRELRPHWFQDLMGLGTALPRACAPATQVCQLMLKAMCSLTAVWQSRQSTGLLPCTESWRKHLVANRQRWKWERLQSSGTDAR